MNIKKGDKVYIIKGKDRGKSGKVDKVLPQENRLVVTGLNVYKKHLKKTAKNPYGGIVDVNMPINRANVQLICPRCEKTSKIVYKIVNKNKIRLCQRCSESVDSPKP